MFVNLVLVIHKIFIYQLQVFNMIFLIFYIFFKMYYGNVIFIYHIELIKMLIIFLVTLKSL